MSIFLMFSIMLAQSAAPRPPVIDQEVLALVRSEIVPALREREKQHGGFDVECTFEAFDLNGKQPPKLKLQRHRRYVVTDGNQLRSLESPGDGIVAVYTTNDRYGFQVLKRDGSDSYSLHEIAENHTQLGDYGGLSSLNVTDRCARVSFEFGGMPFADMVDDDSANFELLEAQSIEDADRRIRIAARYRGPADPSRWKGIYWAEFSSEKPHHTVRCGVSDEAGGSSVSEVFEITWHDDKDSAAVLPKRVSRTSGSPEYGELQVCTFEIPVPEKVDRSSFYLPHYGISEDVIPDKNPRSVRPRSLRWYVILPTLVPLLFLLALFYLRMRQRTRKAS